MISPLQESIYNVLTAGLSYDVYDQPPQSEDGALNAPFPYVTIDDYKPNNNDTDTELAFDGQLQINVWSRHFGNKEASDIQKEIYDLLHRTQPAVVGYGVVDIQQQFAEVLKDPDGITRHGIQRFRVMIQLD